MTTDHYRILDVSRQASAAELRAAFRRRMRAAHPDVGGSEEEAAALTLAFEVLSDPERRAEHDRELAEHPAPAPAPAPSAPESARTPAARPRPMPRPEPDADLTDRQRWIRGALSALALAAVIGLWIAGRHWLDTDVRHWTSDDTKFGWYLATGVVFLLSWIVGPLALISPALTARYGWPLLLGLAGSAYGQIALADDLPNQWLGHLFRDWTWPFWAWLPVTFLAAWALRGLGFALFEAIVSVRVAPRPRRTRDSDRAELFDRFITHHAREDVRLLATTPFERGRAGAAAAVHVTDVTTGEDKIVDLVTMGGYDDLGTLWVLAVDEHGYEIDRIELTAMQAWSRAQDRAERAARR